MRLKQPSVIFSDH